MKDCIFCKIAQKEIPSYKIYEDDVVYAFLDLSQVTPGHTLVIPKTHCQDIFEYDATLAGEVFARIPKIARALQAAFPEMKGLNILNNNRELAGQTVFHSHIHLLPRYAQNDGLTIEFTDHSSQYTEEEMKRIASRIVEELEGEK